MPHQVLELGDEEVARRAHEISQRPTAVARSAEENWYQAVQELRAERELTVLGPQSAKTRQSSK